MPPHVWVVNQGWKMLKLAILFAATCGFVLAIWWYVFDSRAPRSADDAIPLAALRSTIAGDSPNSLPLAVELFRTGSGTAPMFAVETGGGFGKFVMAYTAFGIRYPAGRVIIDAAADRETAMSIGDRGSAKFDDAAYSLLLDWIANADQLILTHEHKDHVMAIVRHPQIANFADRLRLPEAQRYGLLRSARPEQARKLLASLPATVMTRATRIAPGMAAAPAPGHSPGSLVILVRLKNGREYLFIGDIAWSFNDIVTLKTRPRFLQWLMFDPNEQRSDVLRQLRALHDIHDRQSELIIVPSHDSIYLDQLLADGAIELAKS